MRKQLLPDCSILTWCLMPNHFHLMIVAQPHGCQNRSAFGSKHMQQLPYNFGVLLSSYTQMMNRQNHTTGSLFQQKTKAKMLIDINDILRCMHYIHQNPLKAGLVKHSWHDWAYSSLQEYFDETPGICDQELLFTLTGYTRQQLKEDYDTALQTYHG
ncbi:hypothetical protein [Taibaiella helva]|uniref:hypothetical protein n=1 Tax=Taibaiella helva TaxID=2301235 RepID=UPI001E3D0740|nr:hypothetical protein [Taibaiella helva]